MIGRTFDRDHVLAELRAETVLAHFGVEFRRRGDELRTRLCPTCGPRSRDGVCIAADSGAWIDHAHGCRGDVLAMVGGYSGLTDFPAVLALAAEIAGVTRTVRKSVRDRRAAERIKADDDRKRRDEDARALAREIMPSRWHDLARHHPAGERYLGGRGLDAAELCSRGVVRFDPATGDPALPLRDATGAIVGIQFRRIISRDGGKILSERGSIVAGSMLCGRVADLDPDSVDVGILVEGFADVLAAHLAFPGCAIFGAPGAGQLEAIAGVIAPRVVECRGWLLAVPHADGGTGERATARAARVAIDAGLVLDASLYLVDLEPHKDLADALRAGWSWSWPN